MTHSMRGFPVDLTAVGKQFAVWRDHKVVFVVGEGKSRVGWQAGCGITRMRELADVSSLDVPWGLSSPKFWIPPMFTGFLFFSHLGSLRRVTGPRLYK